MIRHAALREVEGWIEPLRVRAAQALEELGRIEPAGYEIADPLGLLLVAEHQPVAAGVFLHLGAGGARLLDRKSVV